MKEAGINVMPATIHPEHDMRVKQALFMWVTIKQWRIGERFNPQRCAVAWANRLLADMEYSDDDGVWIGKRHARIAVIDPKSPTGYACLRCRHNANKKLKDYDNGKHIDEMFPVMVRFWALPMSERPANKRERDAQRSTKRNGARRNSVRISLIRGKITK